jgi:hypothetical protein
LEVVVLVAQHQQAQTTHLVLAAAEELFNVH